MRASEFVKEQQLDEIAPIIAAGARAVGGAAVKGGQGLARGAGKAVQAVGNAVSKGAQIANGAVKQGVQPLGQNTNNTTQSMGQSTPGSATQGTVGTAGTVSNPGTADPKSGISSQIQNQQQSNLEKSQQKLQQQQQIDQQKQTKLDLLKNLNQLKGIDPAINVQKDVDALAKPQGTQTPQDFKNLGTLAKDLEPIIKNQAGAQNLRQLITRMQAIDGQKQQDQQPKDQAQLDQLSQQQPK